MSFFFRRLARILNVVFVNIVILVLLFVSLEIATRTYYVVRRGQSFFRPQTFTSPWITTYDYPPPFVRPDGKAYFRHRDTPTPIEKPRNTIRIIHVGGSTTANERAFAVNQIDVPRAMETKLAEGFEQVSFEVLNAGGMAYSTVQSLINLQFRLVEFNPDIVILMQNVNDSSVNSFKEGATSDYSNKYMQPYYLSPALQGTLSFVGFLTQSRLLTRMGLPQALADKMGDVHVGNDHEYGLHLFKRNLRLIAGVCRLHDIELVLLSQPHTMERSPYMREETFLAYDQAISDVAEEQGVHFIDMFSKFGHDDRYFFDRYHYTPEGIERFASILYSELGSIVSARIEPLSEPQTPQGPR